MAYAYRPIGLSAYREMRRRHRVLMDGDEPVGGLWNNDGENGKGCGPKGPGCVPAPTRFTPDAITREIIDFVRTRYAAHPLRSAPGPCR